MSSKNSSFEKEREKQADEGEAEEKNLVGNEPESEIDVPHGNFGIMSTAENQETLMPGDKPVRADLEEENELKPHSVNAGRAASA